MWRRRQGERRRREWFSGAGCAAAGGILFFLGIAAYIVLGQVLLHAMRKDVAEAEQRVRDAGRPLTLEELDAYYPAVGDEENAALLYQRAFALLDEIDPEGKTVDALCNSFDWSTRHDESLPKLQEEAAAFLVQCEEILTILDLASTMPESRYPISFQEVGPDSFVHWRKLLCCARLEAIRSINAILTGNQSQSVKSQQNIIHMANSLRKEPNLGSQSIRIAVLAMQDECFEMALNLAYLYPETLADIEKIYRESEESGPMIRGLVGERCEFVVTRTNSKDPEVSPIGRVLGYIDPVGQSAHREWRSLRNYESILKCFARLIRLSDEPWEERLEYVSNLRENGERSLKWVESRGHPLYLSLKMIEQLALSEVYSRVGRLAIAIERYRSAHGELPESLDALVPEFIREVPKDPFDGQELRYVVADQDYTLYSVYFDRIDDGGLRPYEVEEFEWEGDWLFVVEQ